MKELERFSRLVENIYDAALDATLWTDTLEEVCAFVQGCTANLLYYSVLKNEIVLFHSWGEDPHYSQLYADTYAPLNPLFPAGSFLEVGTVHALGDVVPIEEFRESRMYREWARPQGHLDALYVNLERTATGAAALAIRRLERDGPFDEDAKARFRLIVPHVQRAVSIGKVIDFHKAGEATLLTTLDRLATGVLLVAADGRLVHVNAKAEEMLLAGDVLRAPNGRLSVVDARLDRELKTAIADAARGDADLGVTGIAVPLDAGDPPALAAHVLPLTSGHRRAMVESRAAAAIFIHRSTLGMPAPLETLTRLYGLTAGEVRVLASVAHASGVAEMATVLGISQSTVKTHLQRLFAKTGARRQADLVKLLAAYANPLQS